MGNNQKSIFRFSRGAFDTGASQVQLVLFKFPYRHFNPAYTGAATGGHEIWDLFYRSACQLYNDMEVNFLPAHVATEAELADPTEFANNMQKVMAAHLHMKINDLTFKAYVDVHKEYQAKNREERAQRRRCCGSSGRSRTGDAD